MQVKTPYHNDAVWRPQKPVERRALAYALKQESPAFKPLRFNKPANMVQ